MRRSIPPVKRPQTAIALPGGDLERAVLNALYDLHPASARDLHTHVGAPAGLVYTTVAKVLDRLKAKRLVVRRREGRAFVYTPVCDRRDLEGALAKRNLSRLLGPEPRPAVAALVDAVEAIDPDLLSDLARAVEKRRRSRRGS